MAPSSLLTPVQADGGEMLLGIFSWHTLSLLLPTKYHLNTTGYLSTVADHVHSIMSTPKIKISEQCFQHLVESMPQKIKVALKAEDVPSKVSSDNLGHYLNLNLC